jgi:hypothetical protein
MSSSIKVLQYCFQKACSAVIKMIHTSCASYPDRSARFCISTRLFDREILWQQMQKMFTHNACCWYVDTLGMNRIPACHRPNSYGIISDAPFLVMSCQVLIRGLAENAYIIHVYLHVYHISYTYMCIIHHIPTCIPNLSCTKWTHGSSSSRYVYVQI